MTAAQICRTCESNQNLISLNDAECKSMVKKLRACADISIEADDGLPQFLCAKCSSDLEFAYTFKIRCEYTDRKFRATLSYGSAAHTTTLPKMEIHDEDGSGVVQSQDGEFFGIDDLIVVDHGEDEDDYADYDDDEHVEDDEIMYLNSTDSMEGTDSRSQTHDPHSDFAEKSPKMFWGFEDQTSSTMDVRVDCDKTDVSTVSSTTSLRNQSLPPNTAKPNSLRVKRPFDCDTCGATFESYAKLNEHKKSHGKERYQCDTCGRWFQKRYHLKNHIEIHKGLKSFECTLCPKRYTNQTNLDRHIRVTHHNEKKHECTECGKCFSQLAILRQHHAVHMTERNFQCDICNKSFKLQNHLRLHRMRHLPVTDRPKRKYKPPKKKYKPKMKACVCTECGKHSNTMALHLSHMKTHSNERPYECKFCKKTFSFQQSLRNHIFLHTGEKPHKCNVCGMIFRQIGHLQGHKFVHSGEKPHYCLVCNKSFALRSNLTVHMRLHTGETPYHCNICPKKFYDSNGLKKHRMIHQRKNEVETKVETPSTMATTQDSIADVFSESKAHDVVAQALSTLGNSVIIADDENGTQYHVDLPSSCSTNDDTMLYTIQ